MPRSCRPARDIGSALSTWHGSAGLDDHWILLQRTCFSRGLTCSRCDFVHQHRQCPRVGIPSLRRVDSNCIGPFIQKNGFSRREGTIWHISIAQCKKKVPRVIGSNIFSDIRDKLSSEAGCDYLKALHSRTDGAEWAHVHVSGKVRTADRKPDLVPANSFTVIEGSMRPAGRNEVYEALIEQLDVDVTHLPKGFAAAPTLVSIDSSGRIPIQVATFSNSDLYI